MAATDDRTVTWMRAAGRRAVVRLPDADLLVNRVKAALHGFESGAISAGWVRPDDPTAIMVPAMTLVLGVQGRDSLWVVADRRLSYGSRRPPIDDAIKMVVLDTSDGVGVLAYAGLGATSQGTQPSQWMSAVLRGRGELTFEQALGVLATVATRELPKHLVGMPGHAHFIIVLAFINSLGPRLYSIDNVVDPNTRQHRYRFTSHQRSIDPSSPSIRLAVGGSGGLYLSQKGPAWRRNLFSLVKAHDQGKLSENAVADHLATLNYEAHLGVLHGTVGHRCIVVWRRRRGLKDKMGGAHRFYTGLSQDSQSNALPSIANGLDIQAISNVLMRHLQDQMRLSAPELPNFAMSASDWNELLAQLPSAPDEKLR